MRSMSLPTVSEIVDAAEHLPNGASLVVHQLEWDDYERVLEGLEERRNLRIDYDSGRLEIVSPSHSHARYDHLIGDLVIAFCEVFRLKVEGFTVVTWKKKALRKGVEPDRSFYIQAATNSGASARDSSIRLSVSSGSWESP